MVNTINSVDAPISIHVIGLGINDKAQLTEPACAAILNADWIVGASRQQEVVAGILSMKPQEAKKSRQTLLLPPLKELKVFIENIIGEAADSDDVKSIVVLASGDPLFYGIGGWLKRSFMDANLHFYPGVSSIQGTCHALGLSLQDVNVLSLHGRPLAKIRRQLKCNSTLVILTDKHSHPRALAQECFNAGFESAEIFVCEALGYEHEKVRSFTVAQLIESSFQFDALHVSVIKLKHSKKEVYEFPGIQDDAFFTDGEKGRGMITKREVRLNILSLMQPVNGDVIWDVGAGCGSVAIELCYWNEMTQVHAIEHHPDRIDCLEKNQDHFGVVTNLHIVPHRAPQAFEGLPNPNKIFIGGSDGELGAILEMLWNKLPVGGLLVASSVMEGSRQYLVSFYQERKQAQDAQCESVQVAVSRGGELAGQLVFRPALPVTLFKWLKKEV
ncbi:MAG: precorrin-6y C5,15-methyltransferase (decarboxylating) subunit CbiE [Bermanella sp.]